MQRLGNCLPIVEAERVLCHLNRLFAQDLQNEIILLSRIFYSWLACSLGFWLRNALLYKKAIGNHRFQK